MYKTTHKNILWQLVEWRLFPRIISRCLLFGWRANGNGDGGNRRKINNEILVSNINKTETKCLFNFNRFRPITSNYTMSDGNNAIAKTQTHLFVSTFFVVLLMFLMSKSFFLDVIDILWNSRFYLVACVRLSRYWVRGEQRVQRAICRWRQILLFKLRNRHNGS